MGVRQGRGGGQTKVWCGGSLNTEFNVDNLHHAFNIGKHVIVPEAQHFIALGFQPCGSRGVFGYRFLMRMLAAVAFDDEIGGVTGEVCDEISDGGLPPEMKAGGFQVSQFAPEYFFCVGLVLT